MRQILFHIPIVNIPVYGYGMMLFFAFIGCNWLARRLCKREGIDGGMIPDLAIWLFISGIMGGRIVFVIQYWYSVPGYTGFDVRPLWDVVKLWDGGLVLYGALFGGAVGYYAFYVRNLKKLGVSNWKMLDVIAPCIVLGIAFGRIGCLFTGCCYGNVACSTCPVVPIHFPVYANSGPPLQKTAPAADMIKRGYQTPDGFRYDQSTFKVEAVEPESGAADAGLRPGDVVVKVNGEGRDRLQNKPANGILNLEVLRDDKKHTLRPFKYQEPLGFAYHKRSFEVESVDPSSAAEKAGLRPGDVIVEVGGKEPYQKTILPTDGILRLTVNRNGEEETLPAFEPRSIGLNPTQPFETISMCLLLFFMLSYYPYKRRDGELMVVLLFVYAIHRFLNEMLRTDTDPVWGTGLTLSQNVSIGIFAVGIILAVVVSRRPLISAIPTAEPGKKPPETGIVAMR